MQTHEIVAWAAFAVSIVLPLTIAKIASKRHKARLQKLQPLLGVVHPKTTKRKESK
jgi:hypothetical protein